MTNEDTNQYIHFWLFNGDCFMAEGPVVYGYQQAIDAYHENEKTFQYSHTLVLDDQGRYSEINLEDRMAEEAAQEAQDAADDEAHRRYESRKSKFL